MEIEIAEGSRMRISGTRADEQGGCEQQSNTRATHQEGLYPSALVLIARSHVIRKIALPG